jgi:enterochelin esterase family protein
MLCAVSSSAADDYALTPDSKRQPGVPQGEVTKHSWSSTNLYPGTVRDYWIYVPKQYDPSRPANLMVFQDGGGYVTSNGQFRVPIVFDNLIHAGAMPVTIGVFVNPGTIPGATPDLPARSARSYEYDTPDERYGRFLVEEFLPPIGKRFNLTTNAAGRCVCGISSGAIAAFSAAWHHPQHFGKVVSHIGSYVNIRGGHVFPSLIRQAKEQPRGNVTEAANTLRKQRLQLRVFLQDGTNDLDNLHGKWPMANQDMAAALKFAGIDHRFELGDGGHSGKHGGAMLPDTLRWLWRDWPKEK